MESGIFLNQPVVIFSRAEANSIYHLKRDLNSQGLKALNPDLGGQLSLGVEHYIPSGAGFQVKGIVYWGPGGYTYNKNDNRQTRIYYSRQLELAFLWKLPIHLKK